MSSPKFIIRGGQATEDMEIVRGDTMNAVLTMLDDTGAAIDLTDCAAALQVRETADSATTILSLSTASGTIVLGGVAGTITFALPAVGTASSAPGRYVYDLQLTWDDSVVETILGPAAFVIKEDVTR
jgi:hypothetical protein